MERSTADNWAHEIFARAQLGDQRRTRRLVEIASAAASYPSGTVTGTKQSPAWTEGAFRFLESDKVSSDGVARAVFESTALAARNESQIYVPLDQTDLTFVDRKHSRGLGPNCSRLPGKLRSVQIMNALALDRAGVPLGVLDQQWWNRPEKKAKNSKKDRRPAQERESWQWIRCIESVVERMKDIAPSTQVCFFMDRGADFWGVLEASERLNVHITIRAQHPRIGRCGSRKFGLWRAIARSKIKGHLQIAIPSGHGRASRIARFEVRYGTYDVRLRNRPRPQLWQHLSAIRIREVGNVPCGEARIEWKLLTTMRCESIEDAQTIVAGYASRWRIEEFREDLEKRLLQP